MNKVIENLVTWTEGNLSCGVPRATNNENVTKSDQRGLLCDSILEK